MPWPVYSERFCYRKGGVPASVSWEVPEGKRAVVTWVGAVNGDTVPGPVAVVVHGIYIWNRQFQASSQSASDTMYAIAYERETIVLQTFADGINAIVCGFLFDDPVGNPASAGQIDVELLVKPEQLPKLPV